MKVAPQEPGFKDNIRVILCNFLYKQSINF